MTASVSQLLVRWSGGDREALDELVPIVYDELRRLGRIYLRRRSQDAMLQPTMLVNEAWIKLSKRDELALGCRSQFYALAAKIMRGILVDHFRQRKAAKRGGSEMILPLENVSEPSETGRRADLLELEDALERLAEIKPRYGQIVELRFFAGLTIEETAAALDTSRATIEREWTFSSAWLRRELGP